MSLKLSLHWPSAAVRKSDSGLKSRRPDRTMAVTSSGDVTKACVAGLASLRPVKLRLYEVTIVFFSPFFTSCLFHWPIQGPHAFASTIPPISDRALDWKINASCWRKSFHFETFALCFLTYDLRHNFATTSIIKNIIIPDIYPYLVINVKHKTNSTHHDNVWQTIIPIIDLLRWQCNDTQTSSDKQHTV